MTLPKKQALNSASLQCLRTESHEIPPFTFSPWEHLSFLGCLVIPTPPPTPFHLWVVLKAAEFPVISPTEALEGVGLHPLGRARA